MGETRTAFTGSAGRGAAGDAGPQEASRREVTALASALVAEYLSPTSSAAHWDQQALALLDALEEHDALAWLTRESESPPE